MSDVVQHKLCILWEHEVRAAAKALRAYYDSQQGKPAGTDITEEELALLSDAFNACLATLWDVGDDSALVLSAAPEQIRLSRKKRVR